MSLLRQECDAIVKESDTCMEIDGVFRRRHLPHWDVDDRPFFITACLEGSISAAGLGRIRHYREELDNRPCPADISQSDWELDKNKLVFAFVDQLLDHQSPVTNLADERLAQIVCDAFLSSPTNATRLHAFVVMPSHHHWLLRLWRTGHYAIRRNAGETASNSAHHAR